MFKDFVGKVDYPFVPRRGRIENIPVYFNLCELLKNEIIKDDELIKLHKFRLTEQHYFDKNFNILTQDVIYATVTHFASFEQIPNQSSVLNRLIEVDEPLIINQSPGELVLKGSSANYIESEKRKKRIGDLGELLVLEYEQERLMKLGSKKQPEHIAVTKGDGLGYDILSYDESGSEIYIEVKTTPKNFDEPFYITQNELLRSIKDSKKFRLYRLYEYEDTTSTAKYRIIRGSLEKLCANPILFKVIIDTNY